MVPSTLPAMTMMMMMMMTMTAMTMTMTTMRLTTTMTKIVAVAARRQWQQQRGRRWAMVAAAKAANNESTDGCMGACNDKSRCRTTTQQPTK